MHPVTISRKRTPSGLRYSVSVSEAWAEGLFNRGINKVTVDVARNGTELVVAPLTDGQVEEYRREERARKSRERYRGYARG